MKGTLLAGVLCIAMVLAASAFTTNSHACEVTQPGDFCGSFEPSHHQKAAGIGAIPVWLLVDLALLFVNRPI